MDYSTPGLAVHHQLPEFTQTHVHWVGNAIQPSHSLSSPSPPTFNLSQLQGLFQWVSSSHQVAKVSASTSVLPMNTQDWSPLGWAALSHKQQQLRWKWAGILFSPKYLTQGSVPISLGKSTISIYLLLRKWQMPQIIHCSTVYEAKRASTRGRANSRSKAILWNTTQSLKGIRKLSVDW